MSTPASPTTSRGRRERHKADKQDRITRAARDRFATQGYAATTTAQIAAVADVATGTVFQYAASKPELLLMAMNDQVASSIETGMRRARRRTDWPQAVLTLIGPLLDLAAQHEENFTVYVRETLFGPAGAHRAQALDLVLQAQRHVHELLLSTTARMRADADLTTAARAAVFAVLLELSSTHLGLRPVETTIDRIRAHLHLILHGVLADTDKEVTP